MGKILNNKRIGNSTSGYHVNEDGSVTQIGNTLQDPQICPVCNSENPGIARYCHVCGNKLSNDTSNSKIYKNTKTVSNTNKDSIMGIIVVVAIIGFVIALVVWNLAEYILGIAVIGVIYAVVLVISRIYHKLFD